MAARLRRQAGGADGGGANVRLPGASSAVAGGSSLFGLFTTTVDEQDPQTPALRDLPTALVALIFALRIANTFLLSTFFVPDEYFQGPEVAHHMAFGYGYLSWEWTSRHIRGALHPALYAALYRVLAALGLDSPGAIVYGPMLIHGVLTALADLHVYVLTARWFGRAAGLSALKCSLLSWFVFYCGPRTLSNSLEAVLTPIALAHLPSPKDRSGANLLVPLSLAALTCIFRPTAAVLWLLVLVPSFSAAGPRNFARAVLMHVLPVAALALGLSIAVDTLFYGKFEFVAWNFVQFNLVQDAGAFYGTHPWHWYFTQGFPAVCGPLLPLFLVGASTPVARKERPSILAAILGTLVVLSIPAHKEFRFAFSLLYLALPFCGLALSRAMEGSGVAGDAVGALPPPSPPLHHDFAGASKQSSLKSKMVAGVFVVLLLLNVPLAYYTSRVHKRAPIEVMEYLRSELSNCPQGDAGQQSCVMVAFLTRCHSTPFYSHVHSPIRMVFPPCPPPDVGFDETPDFLSDPVWWVESQFGSRDEMGGIPSHVVLFDTLENKIAIWLESYRYHLEKRLFFSHIYEENEGRTLLVFKRRETHSRHEI